MKCTGSFKDDRICDLCKEVNSRAYNKCQREYRKSKKRYEDIWSIRDNCPHHHFTYDNDCLLYHACDKKLDGYGEWVSCNPTNSCRRG